MNWITSYVTAGQYCDRPDPQVVAKNNGGIPSDEAFSLWPSFSYTLHYLRTSIWYPLTSLLGNTAPDGQKQAQSSPAHQRRRSSATPAATPSWRTSSYFQWITWWRDRGPSIQMMLFVVIAVIMLWDFVGEVYPRGTNGPSINSNDADNINIAPHGVYRDLEPPSRFKLLLFLARTPTLLTLFWYGRIVLPIPDLVAGANVLKSVRAEALLSGQSSTSASGVSTLK